jgi:acetyl/propionyl-CoA carboxylase alpha subunit
MTSRELHWSIQDEDVTVRLNGDREGGTLELDGEEVPYLIRKQGPKGGTLEIRGQLHPFFMVRNRHEVAIWIGGRTYHLENLERDHPPHADPVDSGEIRAQMPGKIVRVEVQTGDEVTEKQPLLIMESMKMETTLYSPCIGKVVRVGCEAGQAVEMGELLMVLEG